IARYGAPERLMIEGPASLGPILERALSRPVVARDGLLEVEMRDKSEALKVLTVVEASGSQWQGFATRRDTLEDIFVRLVGRMDDGKLKAEGST
ncbi:MAG: hypothetical protein L3J96_07310, partial [Thermoplasmata archaeon]|nr:hypothetical protein [Thermoplasmata archaeon]